MKLFFAVLAAMLAAGFISWLTLSLVQITHHHKALLKKPQEEDTRRPN